MLLLGFLLIPIALAAQSELRINNYAVNIQENTLKSIHASDDPPSDRLNLSNLGLRSIDKNAFDNLEHVRNLDLANNTLSSLPEFVFANLTNLEHLSLADNQLSKFDNTFVGLNKLKFLNISRNPVRYLLKGSFFGLTKSIDIVTLNLDVEFSTLSTEIFENPFLRDGELAEILAKEEPELAKDTIVDDEDSSDMPVAGPFLDEDLRVKICIEDGCVKSVDVLKKDETLASNCQEAQIKHSSNLLSLRQLGITKFESGWYRLQGVPIHTIGLENNNIVRLTSEMLNGLPEEVTHVILSNNKIERLEKGTIENEHLRTLFLANNSISEIENGAFEKTKLTNLFLIHNRLKSCKFVATLPSTLTTLDLYGNQISELTNGCFAKLNKLEVIDLSFNNITELTSQSLRDLSSLRELWFLNNGLRKIQPGAFQDLKSMTVLRIEDNNLESLEKGVFVGLQKIEEIYVTENKLTKITKDSLEGLPETLKDLDLAWNAIESLDAGTFVKVPKRKLSLDNNRISKIAKGSFDLPTLNRLRLSHNLLRKIDGDWFEGLGKLGDLSLSWNGIEEIKKGAAKNLGSLHTLDLSTNLITRLENGALFGIKKSQGRSINLLGTPIELIQGGLFEDL